MNRRLALLLSVLLILIPVLAHTTDGLAHASGAHAAQAITLTVDATEAPRKLFHAQEVIPVSSGPLTLYYPKWIPGEHGPTGPISNLSGLKFTASGKTLPWRRDAVDMYAFHLDVPQGATTVEASLEYLAPMSCHDAMHRRSKDGQPVPGIEHVDTPQEAVEKALSVA